MPPLQSYTQVSNQTPIFSMLLVLFIHFTGIDQQQWILLMSIDVSEPFVAVIVLRYTYNTLMPSHSFKKTYSSFFIMHTLIYARNHNLPPSIEGKWAQIASQRTAQASNHVCPGQSSPIRPAIPASHTGWQMCYVWHSIKLLPLWVAQVCAGELQVVDQSRYSNHASHSSSFTLYSLSTIRWVSDFRSIFQNFTLVCTYIYIYICSCFGDNLR